MATVKTMSTTTTPTTTSSEKTLDRAPFLTASSVVSSPSSPIKSTYKKPFSTTENRPATTTTTTTTTTNSIRKLGLVENYFHGELEKVACINVATILFSSKFDLFANTATVNQAIQLWKRTQPFLRAKVAKNELGEAYFAFIDETRAQSLQNVSYLVYRDAQGGPKSDCKDFWKMLIEREMTIPIDWENGPLWRLMFVELNKNNKENGSKMEHDYCLIITVSHAIFDGLSAFSSLVSLFMILQALVSNTLDERDIIDSKVIPPVEQYLFSYLSETKQSLSSLGSFHQVEPFEKPASFLVGGENDEKISGRVRFNPVMASERYEELKKCGGCGGFYSALDGSQLIGLDELMAISDMSVTKFHLTTFKGDKFKSFAAKCKEHKAKVNSVLNLIFIIAWRQVYQELEKSNGSEDNNDTHKLPINYVSLVNIRPFVKNMDPSLLLWFCNFLNCTFDGKLDFNEAKFWESTFWDVARDESAKFHERLRAGELFRIGESSKPHGPDQIRIHYGLSNLVVPIELVNEIKIVKLGALYSMSSYRRDWVSDLSYNTIINIDGETCWTLYYNSYFVKKETIELFHKCVTDIYNRLC